MGTFGPKPTTCCHVSGPVYEFPTYIRLPLTSISAKNTIRRVPVETLEIADDCRCDIGGDTGATRRHALCRNAETSDVGRHRAANRQARRQASGSRTTHDAVSALARE